MVKTVTVLDRTKEHGSCREPLFLDVAATLQEDPRFALRRVSVETVAQLLDGRYPDLQAPWIFDCRFAYEFYGGHIRGANHAPSVEEVSRVVFAEPGNLANTPLIFHCEFSQQRAPAMVKALRAHASSLGAVLPPLYIMKGGYHDFFRARPELCDPLGYVPMHSAAHSMELAAAARWSPRKGRRKRAKTWSRLGGAESGERGHPLGVSWDGHLEDRLRLPFAEEAETKDALWHSLELW
jgi:rhodanese-related sulfurtransferase